MIVFPVAASKERINIVDALELLDLRPRDPQSRAFPQSSLQVTNAWIMHANELFVQVAPTLACVVYGHDVLHTAAFIYLSIAASESSVTPMFLTKGDGATA